MRIYLSNRNAPLWGVQGIWSTLADEIDLRRVEMDKEKLKKILESHELWLFDDGERADLSGADLRGADLRGADLRCADLSRADLRGADLRCADLTDADLSRANLRGASLNWADLGGANLSGADLTGADLSDAKYSDNTAFFALQCPEEGSFVAWKKCRDDVLVKLLIPEDAKRSSATTRKCRASKAVVLEVIGAEKGISAHTPTFVYEVGKEVASDFFDGNRWNECSHGIHFFITRKEAENY